MVDRSTIRMQQEVSLYSATFLRVLHETSRALHELYTSVQDTCTCHDCYKQIH